MSAAAARQFPVGCRRNVAVTTRIQEGVPGKDPKRDIGSVRDFYNSCNGATKEGSQNLPSSRIQDDELGKAPKRDIGSVRDFYNCPVVAKASQEKRLQENDGALPRASDYYYQEVDYYGKEAEYYHPKYHHQGGNYCHQDTNILSRHRNDNPRTANLLSSQSCPPNEHHREATALPSRQCSGGQSGDTIFLNDRSSTIHQSRTTKHQSIKVQTTHSPAGIKNDGCRPNAEAINSDVFVEVVGPSSLKLSNPEAKTASTIIRRRASALRTFPSGCGRHRDVSVAVLQPTRKKDTVAVGVESSGSNRFPTGKDQNESNNQVAESQSIKMKDTEALWVDSSNSSRGKGLKTSIQLPELQLIKMEDPAVIVVDLSSCEVKEKVQFKYMLATSKEVPAYSSHGKGLYASNQVRESPPTEEQDVEVIGLDSSSEVDEEPQFNATSKKLNNADEVTQVEADEAKAVNKKHEPETNEMGMDVVSHGEKASTDPESLPVNEMDLFENGVGKVTKRNRKKEDCFEIVPLKKGKHEFLVCNTPQAIVPINSVASRSIVEIGDARKKVMQTLFEYRLIYDKILQHNQLAYKLFRENTCTERFIGNVPGVEIGDEFRLRAEMFIICLHRQHQAGIDYIKQHGKDIAVSIVSSGRYANTQIEADVLHYSGSGVSHEDQKLTRGNLALKNSVDEQIPVRVIYCVDKYSGKKRTKTYVYDGLYLAESYSFRTGNQGHSVLMFQLRRIPGQPEIAIEGLQCPRTCISSTVYMDDINQRDANIMCSA